MSKEGTIGTTLREVPKERRTEVAMTEEKRNLKSVESIIKSYEDEQRVKTS